MKISEIKINGLFGLSDYILEIKDNKLIIVAENGGGKTTILKIIYYFLSKQWSLLTKYPFDKIEAIIDNKKYSYDNTKKAKKTDDSIIEEIAQNYPIKSELLKVFEKYEFDNLKEQLFLIEKIELEKSWRKGQLLEVINKIKEHAKPNRKNPNFQEIPILYLPTYRRTENEFMNIFSNLNQFTRGTLMDSFDVIKDDLENLYLELDNFRQNLEKMQEGDYADSEYEYIEDDIEDTEREISEKEKILDNFFSDLWHEFIRIRKSSNSKHINFAEFGMQDVKIIIENFLATVKKETDESAKNNLVSTIQKFTKNVQRYLVNNKNIFYDKTENKILINPKKSNSTELMLKQLSSGEKQILSIFVYLYFTNQNYFVIFDEPELSISIFWQKMLLPDLCKAGASGILAATHSPYIYKNEMFKNVNSLDNFTQTI